MAAWTQTGASSLSWTFNADFAGWTPVSCRIVKCHLPGFWSRFGVFIFLGRFNRFNFRTPFLLTSLTLDFLTPLSLTLHEHASLLELSGRGADWRARFTA